YLHIQIAPALHREPDAKESRTCDKMFVFRVKLRLPGKTEGLETAGVPLCHALPGGIVKVDNARFAAGEEHALASEVFLHVLVLLPADMILRKIREHTG